VENVLTLGEAIEEGVCDVMESSEGGDVNNIKVVNRGKYPVVVLAGQVIVGAKQDRMVSFNTVIPAKTTIELEVYCVEAGRWTYVSDEFKSLDVITPNVLREKSLKDESVQGEIWSSVDEISKSLGSYSSTSALTETYTDEEILKSIEKYKEKFEYISKDEDVVGVVVFYAGKVQTADIFYSNDFLHKVWDMLFAGYSLDAILSGELGEPLSKDEIEDLIKDISKANREKLDSNKGRYTLKYKKMEGFENQYDDEFIQMNLQFE
jgi:hypothetical protein